MMVWAGPLARSVGERRVAQRAFGLALAALLHLLLLLGLLRTLTAPGAPPTARAQEMILRLLPRLQSAPVDNAAPPAIASPQLRARIIPVVPPLLGTAPPPSLSGLGQSLFGCAPQDLAGLTREQRAHCATGLARPDDTVMAEPPSHVKDPRRRAAEMAAKNTPAKIPCTYMTNTPGPYGSVAPATMLSLACLRRGIFGDGLKPLSGIDH